MTISARSLCKVLYINKKPRQLHRLPGEKIGCGGRIRTYDLQVMSLTSYQAAPPRGRVSTLYVCLLGASIIRQITGFLRIA
jgi:hypothetical protein